MNSHPDLASGISLIDPDGIPVTGDQKLILCPVTSPAGEGWIGLNDGSIAWLSLGELDLEEVGRYWQGPVTRVSRSPLSCADLEEAIRGEGDLQVAPRGTPFQFTVWKHLMRIPLGQTITYGEIAESIGSPGGARAVGAAVGANPVAWLIPCHRVVPASGGPGHYRWGTPAKEKLLEWEKACQPGNSRNSIPDKHKRLEAMLLKAQRIEDIARLVGDIAHDLNNLLAPIRMSTELLKRKVSDKSLDRYLEIIETSTGRARSVIQEILAFSRETDGGDKQLIEVTPVIRELERISRETFPKRIHLASAYPKEMPWVEMDPTQLHRAILNLLINARDAIEGEGAITIRISSHDLEMQVSAGKRQLLPGRFVCISITDTGCGIPEKIRDHIFDPFFTTKSKEQGTGLGLSSVYSIVSRAGGFIDLESAVGQGSTFHVYLPISTNRLLASLVDD